MSPGQRIRLARTLIVPNLATKDLDALAEQKPGFVWSVEKNEGFNAESSRLDAIARVIGVSLDWLIRGDGAPPTAASVAAAVGKARAAKTKRDAEKAAAAAEAAGKGAA